MSNPVERLLAQARVALAASERLAGPTAEMWQAAQGVLGLTPAASFAESQSACERLLAAVTVWTHAQIDVGEMVRAVNVEAEPELEAEGPLPRDVN